MQHGYSNKLAFWEQRFHVLCLDAGPSAVNQENIEFNSQARYSPAGAGKSSQTVRQDPQISSKVHQLGSLNDGY